LLYVAVTRARRMLVLGEGFSKQTGPWLQWIEQLFETAQSGAIEKARDGKTQTVRFKGFAVKVLPASQLNVPEQLAFKADTILVGEPGIPRVEKPRIAGAMEMTPSDLASLAGCFRYFHWTRILGLSEPGLAPTGSSAQMRLGSIAHKVLETGVAHAEVADLDGVFQSAEWRELSSASPERELPFIMHIDVGGKDCWVRGRMDAVVAPVGDVIEGLPRAPRVIDYKYATWREGAEEQYEMQMTAYSLALMKALATNRAVAELWYLKSPMKIVRREYTIDEAGQALSDLLAKYARAVESDEWSAADRSYCDRIECGFRERCWSTT